ncbi:MAG: type II secretion system protein [Planctomycetota bacterium]
MNHRSVGDRPERRAFSLIELLVVISIIALLVGILLPTLGSARFTAKVLQDLSNLRQMELAHHAYFTDNGGFMINAGLPHGIAHNNIDAAWITTLKRQYNSDLVLRSPIDDSPHWEDDGGVPVPNVVPATPATYRLTSYGINTHLCDVDENGVNPWGPSLTNPLAGPANTQVDMVEQPSDMVHFFIMAFEGDFAGADHVHPEDWDLVGNPLAGGFAPEQIEIDAVGGPERSFQSKSNYAFLDGSAKTAEFGSVYRDILNNRFDPHPMVARP